jgi:hypothetical protein
LARKGFAASYGSREHSSKDWNMKPYWTPLQVEKSKDKAAFLLNRFPHVVPPLFLDEEIRS